MYVLSVVVPAGGAGRTGDCHPIHPKWKSTIGPGTSGRICDLRPVGSGDRLLPLPLTHRGRGHRYSSRSINRPTNVVIIIIIIIIIVIKLSSSYVTAATVLRMFRFHFLAVLLLYIYVNNIP